MRERPILFSAPMVRALLAGTKTQTRRVVTPQPDFAQVHTWKGREIRDCESRAWCWKEHDFGDGDAINANPGPEMAALCPYGQPGDRLWVRETWGLHEYHDFTGWHRGSVAGATKAIRDVWDLAFRADWAEGAEEPFWRPSIHMPRWASRISLDVTEVRVQRLQSISDADALAEGIDPSEWTGGPAHESPRAAFFELWDRINGKRPGCSWEANPWVWAVSFKLAEPA